MVDFLINFQETIDRQKQSQRLIFQKIYNQALAKL